MRDRFEVWIESSSSISKIYSSGYTLVLMDSCFIVEYSDIIELLASENNVTATGRIPAVCDFTRHEVRSISVKAGRNPWRALRKALEEADVTVHVKPWTHKHDIMKL